VKSGKLLCKGVGLAGIVVAVIVAIIAMTTGGKKSELGYPAPIHTSIEKLAGMYDVFLLDCDGVLWSGARQIDRAFEVVSWLSKLPGKKVFFITNSSGRTRAEYAEKIRKFGFAEVKPEQVYSSSYTTARYLGQKTDIKKVHVVG
jgi:hypothetical protein